VPVCARVPCVSRLPPVSFYRYPYVERRGGLRFFFGLIHRHSGRSSCVVVSYSFALSFVFLSAGHSCSCTRRTLVACGRQPAVGARRHAYLNETQITFLGCNQRQ
jgi:hypothetical protein